jgi:ATP-dependent 26S proteasome regulatory subunit
MAMQPPLLLYSRLARPCRLIARRRYPAAWLPSSRRFHLSSRWRSSVPPDPHGSPDSATGRSDIANNAPVDERVEPAEEEAESATTSTPGTIPSQRSSGRTGPYGSGVRRALRNRKPPQDYTPPVATIPNWFHERNTILYHGAEGAEKLRSPLLRVEQQNANQDTSVEEVLVRGGTGGHNDGSSEPAGSGNRYVLSHAVWEELYASAKAGLMLPAAEFANEPAALKSHLVLQYPGEDGILFLDAVVQKLAHILGANLVTLNAQDIAQLCSEQDRADSGMTSPIRSLGYEVYRPSSSTAWQDGDEAANEGEDEGELEVSGVSSRGRPELAAPRFITIESTRDLSDIQLPNWLGLKSLMTSLNGPAADASANAASRNGTNRVEHRWYRLVNELISPSTPKPQPQPSVEEDGSSEVVEEPEKRTSPGPVVIVQVQDYKDIQATQEGSKFISLLQQVIQSRRREGERILLVGTVTRDIHSPTDRESSRFLQTVLDDPFSRTLIITPAMDAKVVEKVFTEDRKRRTTEINIRHLQDLLRTRLNENATPADPSIFSDRTWALDPTAVKESGLEDRYWTYNHVHWVATLALGCAEPNETLNLSHIQRGMKMIEETDRVRNGWLQDKLPKGASSGSESRRKLLLASLRKTCNSHEKKLLNGVVDADSIRTTFADVHVPPETIEALKTLTSLSLIRPEAFAYGVLATDKIPGLLLYGPPGTGKTLLAKAVARESGATVLEVSGSEVYDMYVGEGEKNVKAIFTLAKKLSPCVVFIDEADAIFCSRTGASSRTSHRELINQFLREWDGMNDMSAFIMVATNRPFDLDDAVLRRLPRRLLVDLPTEQDRRSILQIHLKEEKLDPSVDLEELAHRTPLYSGSDLKNLCVAAALACVREENDAAAKHLGEQPYQYPERRVLTKAHFERGMEEISASISEDMSSLTAIRKFDEKYGDRKGRRKKGPSWGFIAPSEAESSRETARVRT